MASKTKTIIIIAVLCFVLAGCSPPTTHKTPTPPTTIPPITITPTTPPPIILPPVTITPEPTEPTSLPTEDTGFNVRKGNGETIKLIDNPAANDITYAQLVNFILEDQTDKSEYVDGGPDNFSCMDFAEEVHNNAEAAGIKAGFVIVDFEDHGIGHALNAFKTTDLGLVFTDCTGGKQSRQWINGRYLYTIKPPTTFTYNINTGETTPTISEEIEDWDTIAYLVIGREYGTIDIKVAKSPEYTYYLDYTERWNSYKALMEDYNREVEQYNQEVGSRIYYIGTPELTQVEDWKDRLDTKEHELNKLARNLGEYYYYLDRDKKVVSNYTIYWSENNQQ